MLDEAMRMFGLDCDIENAMRPLSPGGSVLELFQVAPPSVVL
jgi:hypothetical protein